MFLTVRKGVVMSEHKLGIWARMTRRMLVFAVSRSLLDLSQLMESSDKFFLEQVAREYFRSEFENFLGLFPSNITQKNKKMKEKVIRGSS